MTFDGDKTHRHGSQRQHRLGLHHSLRWQAGYSHQAVPLTLKSPIHLCSWCSAFHFSFSAISPQETRALQRLLLWWLSHAAGRPLGVFYHLPNRSLLLLLFCVCSFNLLQFLKFFFKILPTFVCSLEGHMIQHVWRGENNLQGWLSPTVWVLELGDKNLCPINHPSHHPLPPSKFL